MKKSQPHLAAAIKMGEKMDLGKGQGADPTSRQRQVSRSILCISGTRRWPLAGWTGRLIKNLRE